MRRAFVLLALTGIVVGNTTAAQAGDGRGSFSVECPYDHTLNDDPIVYPNQPGVSHSHDFFGNVSTTASSTYDSMLASHTSCGYLADTAGYWNPTAYINGVRVPAIRVSAYYFGAPSGSVVARHASLKTSSRPAAADAVKGEARFSFS